MHLKLFFVPAMTKFCLPAEAADSRVLSLRVHIFGRLQPTKIEVTSCRSYSWNLATEAISGGKDLTWSPFQQHFSGPKPSRPETLNPRS